jgi:hypothetical protein
LGYVVLGGSELKPVLKLNEDAVKIKTEATATVQIICQNKEAELREKINA